MYSLECLSRMALPKVDRKWDFGQRQVLTGGSSYVRKVRRAGAARIVITVER